MPKHPISHASPTHVTMHGRELLSFGGCNYLGLAHHPAVHTAVMRGLAQFGLTTSASRETTGNTTAHDRLERELAEFLGAEDSVVVPDGYTANLAIAETLAKDTPGHAVAVVDRRAHKSVHEAVFGAGLDIAIYEHRDAGQAAALVQRHAGRGVVLFTDGIFTAEGSVAPLRELVASLPAEGVTLVVDDCHGFCTMGPRGQGTLSALGLPMGDPRVVVTTTLAKGLGCHGGCVAGSSEVCARVRRRASSYICTTPVSPAIAVGAVAALEVVRAEPERVARLRERAAQLRAGVREMGLNAVETPAPIVAFTLEGGDAAMRRVHAEMLDAGVLAPLIAYPGGPAPLYFRCSVTSEHGRADVERLLGLLGSCVSGVCAA